MSLLELVIAALLVFFFWKQIFRPLLFGGVLFPMFRSSDTRLTRDLEQSEEDIRAAEISTRIVDNRKKADALRRGKVNRSNDQ